MSIAEQEHVGMDLIGYDQDAVATTDIRQCLKFLQRPDSSRGAVWAAQKKCPCIPPNAGGEIGKVEFIPGLPLNERILDDDVVSCDHILQRQVSWGLDHHTIPFVSRESQQDVDRRDYARWAKYQPVLVDDPSMPVPQPLEDGFTERRTAFRVAIDPVLCSFFQGCNDRLRTVEVHISNPKRQYGRVTEVVAVVVPLKGLCSPSVVNRIKIVLHRILMNGTFHSQCRPRGEDLSLGRWA